MGAFLLFAHALRLVKTKTEARLARGHHESMAASQPSDLPDSAVILAGALPNPTLHASMSIIAPSLAACFASQFWDTQTP